MSVVTSTSKRWPGTVAFKEYLTYPEYIAVRDCFATAVALKDALPANWERACLAGIFTCVSEWHLTGMPTPLTPETFPATPRKDVSALFAQLLQASTNIINGESESPPA